MRRPRKPQFGRKLPLPKNVCPESTKFHGRLFGAREHEYVKRFKGQRPTSAVNFVRRIDEIVHTDTSQDSAPKKEEKIPSLKVQQQVKGAVYRWYMNRFKKLREDFDKYQEITEKEVKDTAKYYE
jgi:hypothetical protein